MSDSPQREWMQRVVETSAAAAECCLPTQTQLLQTFATATELRASPWADYFEHVYGIRTMVFPFSLGEIAFFYWDRLPLTAKASLKLREQQPGGERWSYMVIEGPALRFGELYGHGFAWGRVRHSALRPSEWRSHGNVWRCLHPWCSGPGRYVPEVFARLAISEGLPSHTRAEVFHACCDSHDWPQGTAWFFLAPGSGVFLDLRRTVVLRTHADLATRFGFSCWGSVLDETCHSWCERECYVETVEALRTEGYDTIQFTNYDAEHYADYEVWDLRVGSADWQNDGCLPDYPRGTLTRGWAGTGEECRCRRGGDLLRCDG